MTPQLVRLLDEVRGAWRFRYAAVATAFVVALIGWAVVFALPDRFEGDAQVFVDTRTALGPVLKGLTVDQSVDAQINYVRQSLLERPQLEKVALATGVLPQSMTDARARARVLEDFSNRITLRVLSAGTPGEERAVAGTVYDFQYQDVSRPRALSVVQALLDSFVEGTLGGKREGSAQAQKFLETQIKDYEQRLSAAEDRLAAFKRKNIGLMPSELGGYFAQLQKETDDAKKTETELSIALSRREELIKQLHSDQAVSAAGSPVAIAGGRGVAGGDALSRIQQTQAELDELLLKYTDQHPDVIAARAALAELQKRRAAELEAVRRGDPAAIAASGANNSPVYQTLQLDLNKTDVEVAALRRALEQHQRTVAELRRQLNVAPQVEAEYQQLNRDYDVNKAQYTALLETYQKASLGERADTAGSVRFKIMLPPTVPVAPVWPRRAAFLSGIWIAALLVGAAVAYGLNVLKPVVVSVRAMSELSSFPILGVVGGAFPSRERAQARRHVWRLAVAGACWVLAFAVVLALSWSGARLPLHAVRSLVQT